MDTFQYILHCYLQSNPNLIPILFKDIFTFIYNVVPPIIEPIGLDFSLPNTVDTDKITTASVVVSLDASVMAKYKLICNLLLNFT